MLKVLKCLFKKKKKVIFTQFCIFGEDVSDVWELSATCIHIMLGQKSSNNCFYAQRENDRV